MRVEMRAARIERWVLGIALLLIALLFLAQLSALAMHRLDYPTIDDWRYYAGWSRMPQTLQLEWLFRPAQDTLHVTGKLLDWLVFRTVSHDFNVLATLSFAVFMGAFLLISLALLSLICRGRTVLLLSALGVMALPLAANPYWVAISPHQRLEPAIAYHQMLPVLGLVGLALLLVIDRRKWPRGLASGLAGLLSVAVALTYSSGAFAMLCFGAVVVSSALFRGAGRRFEAGGIGRLGGVVLGLSAAILALHVLVPLQVIGANPLVDSRDPAGLAWPTQAAFWSFLFGLFDRAVLSTELGTISSLRGVAVCAVVTLPALWLVALGMRARLSGRDRAAGVALAATLLAVLAYVALVSYGRANFGSRYLVGGSTLAPADYAHARFFYWWITAILPLVVVAWGIALERSVSPRAARLAIPLLAVLLLLPKAQHADSRYGYFQYWSYQELYEYDARRLGGLVVADAKMIRLRSPRGTWRTLTHPPRWLCFRASRSGATFVTRFELPCDTPR